jgi:DNA-binding CsgD family transcriptional regulator
LLGVGERTADADVLDRESELARLSNALTDAAAGSGPVLAIEGAAGIGKTALLARAREMAAERGLRVLAARGGELERDVAFGIVRQLFEAALHGMNAGARSSVLAGAAGVAGDVLGFGEGSGAPRLDAVLHGFFWLTSNLADEMPLLLVVDDGQWADVESLQVLSYVGRRLESIAATIMFGVRVGESGPSAELLATVLDEVGAESVRPQPLSADAAAVLVASLMKGPSDEAFLAACMEASGGNPFLLRELLAAASDQQLTATAADVDRILLLGSQAVQRTVLARLRRLGPAPVRFARSVALLGLEARPADAALLADLTSHEAAGAADALRGASVIHGTTGLDFVHPLVRSAVYDDISPGLRSQGHRRAAQLLSDRSGVSARIAAHLLSVDPAGDPWAVAQLRAAAVAAAASGALEAAAGYLRRAADEPPIEPTARQEVLAELGRVLYPVDPMAALAPLRAAYDLADEGAVVGAAADLARAYQLAGRAAEAVQVLDDTLERLRPAGLDPDTESRLATEAVVAMWFSEHGQRSGWRNRMRALGEIAGSTVSERRLLLQQALAEHYQTSAPRMLVSARRVRDLGGPEDGPRTGSLDDFMLPLLLMNGEGYEDSERLLLRWFQDAQDRGAVAIAACSNALLAQVHYRLGALRDAEAEAESAWQLASGHGTEREFVWWCALGTLLRVWVARGNVSAAADLIESLGLDGEIPLVRLVPIFQEVRGEVRLAQARTAEAVTDLYAVADLLGRPFSLADVLWESLAVDGLLALGRRDEARELAAQAVTAARSYEAALPLGRALRAEGLAAGGERGLALLEESVEVLAGSPCRFELDRSHVERGAALRRIGRRRDAIERLRAGLDLATRCGAERLATRAREELGVLGSRPRSSVISGVEALTASERRVVQLAASGLSNPQIAQALFVTRKTVEAHLGRAFPKLGVTSREELAAVLAGGS